MRSAVEARLRADLEVNLVYDSGIQILSRKESNTLGCYFRILISWVDPGSCAVTAT